jgi:hypothetical protein
LTTKENIPPFIEIYLKQDIQDLQLLGKIRDELKEAGMREEIQLREKGIECYEKVKGFWENKYLDEKVLIEE